MYSLVVLTFALIQFEYSQPVHKRKKKRKKRVSDSLVALPFYQPSLNLDHFPAVIIYSVRKSDYGHVQSA